MIEKVGGGSRGKCNQGWGHEGTPGGVREGLD